MLKQKIYVSGKITGLYLPDAIKNFKETSKKLEKLDFEVINPMELVKKQNGWKWIDYMKKDIKLLIECDAIFMMDNWVNSKGAKIEHDLAIGLGLKCFYEFDIKI